MMAFLLRLCVASLLCLLPAAAQKALPASPSTAEKAELVYVVQLSRHGVRSPTAKAEQYDKFSTGAWPAWPVPPGELTPHGYQVMREFGIWDRSLLNREGLLHAGCADAGRVKIHADSDQRTIATAKALAEGMFPGCDVPVEANAEGVNDPLFHLPAGSVTPEAGALAAAAVTGRIGGDAQAVARAYHASLAELDRVLATCGTAGTPHERTSIFDVPATVDAGAGDHMAVMRGPLSTAGTLTENFLLEYTEGMPEKDVAWGCVDGAKLRTLIDLHTASSDVVLRTPAVAVPQASALLRVVERSLAQAVMGKAVTGAMGKPGDKALLMVGHDTNLSNIAGALRLNWIVDGRRDDTPPGSTLVFELWRAGAQYSVRTYFTAQTLEQMRNATPLNETEAPPRVGVFVPACSGVDGACSWKGFSAALAP